MNDYSYIQQYGWILEIKKGATDEYMHKIYKHSQLNNIHRIQIHKVKLQIKVRER